MFVLLLLTLAVAVAIDAQTYTKRLVYYACPEYAFLSVQSKDIRSTTKYAAAMIEKCPERHLHFLR